MAFDSSCRKKVGIIGAGPAGLAAGYQLAKKGACVHIFEKSDQVGGLSKTIDLWGQKVDIGPHRFFSSDTRVNKLWLEVAGQDYVMVNRLTRIYYNKKFFYYPIRIFDVLTKLGLFTSSLCLLSYFKELIIPSKSNGSFENWVTNRFGKRLYSIFFKSYTEKLWGIPCSEIDSDFAAQRIQKLSLAEAVKNALKIGGKNNHKTLLDRFAYPINGTGMIYERMKNFIEERGGRVYLTTPVQRVLTKNKTAYGIQIDNNTVYEYDDIVSSMPLTLLISQMIDVPSYIVEGAGRLKYRNTILVYLKVESENLFPDNWLYVHSPHLKLGRITNFRNWVNTLYGNQKSTIVALEYWCYPHDEIWMSDDKDLENLGVKELHETGLTGASKITGAYVHRISKSYPVYSKGYKNDLNRIEIYLGKISKLHVIGRNGSFKYNNQDHSLLMGILATENILDNMSHDLWAVNTDYDNYQEKSAISDTGLQIF